MKNKVINLGTANVDEIIKTDVLPRVGETRFSHRYCALLGGKGANQAVAARRAGASVVFLGSIGADNYGEFVRKKLKENDIDTSFLVTCKEKPTGIAHVWAEDSGHNSIICYPGANLGSEEEQLRNFREILEPGDVILLTLEYRKDFIKEIAGTAKERGCRLILDPSGHVEIGKDTGIAQDTYLIKPNEVEAEQLTGIAVRTKEDGFAAAERLRNLGYAHPVVSMGEKGAVACIENEIRFFEPRKVRTVDSTGAGDAFLGYLAAALAENRDLAWALGLAVRAAALSTEKTGAAEAVPWRGEVEEI